MFWWLVVVGLAWGDDPRLSWMRDVACAETATRAKLTFLTTIMDVPGHTSSAHTFEILLALGENARTPEILQVHVFLDRLFGTANASDADATTALRDAIRSTQQTHSSKLDAAADESQLGKIVAHVFGRQPAYVELFRYADRVLSGRLVAVGNADVVLRHLGALDADAFEQEPPLALVLAVSMPNSRFLDTCKRRSDLLTHDLMDRCSVWSGRGYSWDVEVFKAPLVNACYELLEFASPIYMNSIGAENRVGHFLATSGYELFNPCRSLVVEHWHCEAKMHTKEKSISAALLGPGGFVGPQTVTRGVRCTNATRAIRPSRDVFDVPKEPVLSCPAAVAELRRLLDTTPEQRKRYMFKSSTQKQWITPRIGSALPPSSSTPHVPCASNDSDEPTVNLTVLTTLHRSETPHRNEELAVLGINAKSPHVGEVRVLMEGGDTASLRERVARASNSTWYPVKAAHLAKINAHVVDRKPGFADLFRYASRALPNRLVAVANADVVLRNLDLLDPDAFDASPPLALVLSTTRPFALYLNSQCKALQAQSPHVMRQYARHFLLDTCEEWENRGWTWSVEIFRSPIVGGRYDRLNESAAMNTVNGHNLAGHFLAASGYELANPCKATVAEEWHCEVVSWDALLNDHPPLSHRVDIPKLQAANLNGTFVAPQASPRGLRCAR